MTGDSHHGDSAPPSNVGTPSATAPRQPRRFSKKLTVWIALPWAAPLVHIVYCVNLSLQPVLSTAIYLAYHMMWIGVEVGAAAILSSIIAIAGARRTPRPADGASTRGDGTRR